jgi:hypothetical protein
MQEPTEYTVPTVRIEDGNGGYIVINKTDLQPHHTLHHEFSEPPPKRTARKPKQD